VDHFDALLFGAARTVSLLNNVDHELQLEMFANRHVLKTSLHVRLQFAERVLQLAYPLPHVYGFLVDIGLYILLLYCARRLGDLKDFF
jgi:hypothetical protein